MIVFIFLINLLNFSLFVLPEVHPFTHHPVNGNSFNLPSGKARKPLWGASTKPVLEGVSQKGLPLLSSMANFYIAGQSILPFPRI